MWFELRSVASIVTRHLAYLHYLLAGHIIRLMPLTLTEHVSIDSSLFHCRCRRIPISVTPHKPRRKSDPCPLHGDYLHLPLTCFSFTLFCLEFSSALYYRKFITSFPQVQFPFSDFPSSGPSISSPRQQYQVGETAHLTCSAPRSRPPTLLAWYINGEPVSRAQGSDIRSARGCVSTQKL